MAAGAAACAVAADDHLAQPGSATADAHDGGGGAAAPSLDIETPLRGLSSHQPALDARISAGLRAAVETEFGKGVVAGVCSILVREDARALNRHTIAPS